MNKKIVTFGEIMLRLSPPNFKRFTQANSFDVVYGGTEANVAISLANYGFDSCFVTKLPEHEVGQAALNELRKYGVNTEYIIRGGSRIGIYFYEKGASMRASKIIYDRANSAIADADISDFDFKSIFKDACWFHISGITPAISKKAATLTKEVMQLAKQNNITVSVDLNYRKKLWAPQDAQTTMKDLMQYVDICIGNEEDASLCLGFTPKSFADNQKINLESYKNIFEKMVKEFNFKLVATSLRNSFSASKNGWSACCYDGRNFYHSSEYDIDIVDRIGAGDSFAAGLICGILDGKSIQQTLDFAVAASALKHTISGDFNQVNRTEIEALISGDSSGRIKR